MSEILATLEGKRSVKDTKSALVKDYSVRVSDILVSLNDDKSLTDEGRAYLYTASKIIGKTAQITVKLDADADAQTFAVVDASLSDIISTLVKAQILVDDSKRSVSDLQDEVAKLRAQIAELTQAQTQTTSADDARKASADARKSARTRASAKTNAKTNA